MLVNDGRIVAGFHFFCSLPMEMWASNEITWPVVLFIHGVDEGGLESFVSAT